MERPNRVEIGLGNGCKLVAEQNTDPNYSREMFVGIEGPDGAWLQDLAVIRSAYHYKGDVPVWNDKQMEMLVYGDEDSEDFTETFNINLREDKEGE